MSQLGDWKCHKIVKAGKVTPAQITRDADEGTYTITVEDGNGAPCKVVVRNDFLARGTPQVGDYLVIYDDGYKSWSPAKAFEDGYTRIDADAHQN